MERSEELTKNTFIITIGKISTQFITFLLLPLYTSLLKAEEYGTVDLITTIVALFIPILSLMIDQAVFRFLLACQTQEEQKETISSAFIVLILLNCGFIFLYIILLLFIYQKYKIWILLILSITSFSNFFLQVSRGLKHINDYALGSFICSVVTTILNILCIAFLHMGAIGMLIATFAGNFICTLFLALKLDIIKYISLHYFNKECALAQLKYSIPLVPNQLSLWVMNSSDRFIVAFMLGAGANGILAVAHKFPSIYMTFFNIFLLAWHESGAIHYFDEDRDDFFSDMLGKIITIFSTMCMGIITILPFVFNVLVNDSYHEAYFNIPIYLIGFLFNVIIGLLGVIYVATKKTIEIAKSTLLAAFINIIVNLLLIKKLGLYAASISTFVGYIITMIYRIIDTRKYIDIKYNVKQYILIGFALSICCIIYYMNNKIISILFIPFFGGISYFVNKDIIGSILIILKEKKNKLGE